MCPDAQTLALFLAHALGPEERGRVTAHVASCEVCTELLLEAGADQPEQSAPEAEPDVQAPAIRVRDFEIFEPIGQGGLAQVWAGVHRARGVPIAMKVLTHASMRGIDHRATFNHEVRAVAALDHPGIVMVLDYGDLGPDVEAASGGRLPARSPYFVMELASGGTLGDVARARHPPAWRTLFEALSALLDALAHAHARGVIHCDLKPSNVLCCLPGDKRPGLKLADFHLAHALGRETPAPGYRGIAGTPPYMAPEQIQGQWRDYGPWTDLYALGCLAFELCCGRRAFVGRGFREIALAHLAAERQPFEPRTPVPPGLGAWLERLLACRPADRFQGAAEAFLALGRLDDAAGEVREKTASVADTDPATLVTPRQVTTLATQSARGETCPLPTTTRDAELPAVPESWAEPKREGDAPELLGAGLSLFGLRAVPLRGRVAERDTLWQALATVHAERRPRAVVLRGGAGYGKTRLCEWLCERAHEVGIARVWRARFGPKWGPGQGLEAMLCRGLRAEGLDGEELEARLEGLLRAAGVLAVEERRALIDLVAGPGSGPVSGTDAPVTSLERHARIRRLLGLFALRHTAVVAIDDVQWGEEALELLEHVLDAPPCAVLFVLTAREDALAERPGAEARLARLERRPEVARIDVGPLGPRDTLDLVRGLVDLGEGLAREVARRVAGNPLFAVQLVGHWVDRGLLAPSEAGLALEDRAASELPGDLQRVWADRIERVLQAFGEDVACALELAAVLGFDVDGDEWARGRERLALGGAPERLVEELARLRLIEPRGGARVPGFAFAHGMLREALERRAEEHGRLRGYHRICADLLAEPERVGLHRLAASQSAEAVFPLLEGVARRLQRGDGHGALLLCDRLDAALDQVASEDDPRRARSLLLRTRAVRSRGDLDAAERSAQRALEVASRADWAEGVAQAELELARVAMSRGAYQVARDLLAGAEDAEALMVVGVAAVRSGDLEEGRRTLVLARDRLARSDDRAYLRIPCELQLGTVLLQGGDLREAETCAASALSLAERRGAGLLVAEASNLLGDVTRHAGRLQEAERRYQEARDRFWRIGHRNVSVCELNLALCELARGSFEAARDRLHGSLEVLEARGSRSLLVLAHAFLAHAQAGLGEWGEVAAHLTATRQGLEGRRFADLDLARAADAISALAEAAGQALPAALAREVGAGQRRAIGI